MSSHPIINNKKHIPVTVRDATHEDIPQILALVRKYSTVPDPETGVINITAPPSEELLSKIIEAKECVVAEKIIIPGGDGADGTSISERKIIVAYNLRRTQTVDSSVAFAHGFAKTLEVASFIDKFPKSTKQNADDDVEDEDDMPNPYKGSKISFGNQTIVDEEAQRTNVIDELTLAFSKQAVSRFGQRYILASVLKSNVKSMKMSARMGATMIGEFTHHPQQQQQSQNSQPSLENNNMVLWISPDLIKLIEQLGSVIEERKQWKGN